MMKFQNGFKRIRMEHPTFKRIRLLLPGHLRVDLMLMLNIPLTFFFRLKSFFLFFRRKSFFLSWFRCRDFRDLGSGHPGLSCGDFWVRHPTLMWVPLHQNPHFPPTNVRKGQRLMGGPNGQRRFTSAMQSRPEHSGVF